MTDEKAMETVQETLIPEAAPAEEKQPAAKKTRKPSAKKAAAPKEAKAPKAAKAVKEAAEEKAAPAKKAAAPRKKAAALTTKVVIELPEKSASSEDLLERAKQDWINKGNSVSDIQNLALYVNASEGTVYYVVNDDYLSGSFAF